MGVDFQMVAYKELATFGVENISSKCCKFSSVEECSSNL